MCTLLTENTLRKINDLSRIKTVHETTMSVTYAKLVVDGVEIFEIDVLENIYKVGKVDMLSTFKKNTGA